MRASAALLLLALLPACERRQTGAADTFLSRDSAGIHIADNRAPQWAEHGGWTLAQQPHLDIGAEGVPGHDLDDVVGVVRLGDGRIAVANAGHQEIRLFDPAGTLVGKMGRRGEGPGEFTGLSALFLLPGDSLLVIDGRLRRLTVFTAEGATARTARLSDPPGAGVRTPFLLLPDRTLLARPGFSFSSQTRPGIHRDSVLITRYDLNGSPVDTAGRFVEREVFVYQESGNSLAGELPFGRSTYFAPAAGGFYVGDGRQLSIEVRSGNGTLRSMVRAQRPNRAVSDQDVAYLKQPEPGTSQADQTFWQRVLASIELPTQFPAIAGLVADSAGFLWVRDYSYPPDSQPPTWQIFDRDGRWLGGLELPSRFRMLHIGADEIIGVWRDELDVQHVRAYRLTRTQ